MALFLSGAVAMAAGVFIRACEGGVPAELFTSWCGEAPPLAALATHHHCAGCGVFAVGAGLAALAPLLALGRRLRQRATP